MKVMTPREIVSELDQFIIGQEQAKRMVAVAMRNRWRRQRIDPELRDEVAPKNIIMMGPTGVGKTEIARRLAKLAGSPFCKVEATKFTEVGYVGRDVESMIRDLMEIGINLVKEEEQAKIKVKAEQAAEERLLDLLLPKSPSTSSRPTSSQSGGAIPLGPIGSPFGASFGGSTEGDEPPADATTQEQQSSTREKLRKLWRDGKLDDRTVDIQVSAQGPRVEVMAIPGMEDMEMQFKDMFSKVFPQRKKSRNMRVKDAYDILVQEESERLVDMDKVTDLARERVEQSGIIFLDEIDKIVSREGGGKNVDVSREGVQRDLLPVVEGCVVNTKYGMVKTDHILFIAAGAFHLSKPSDLVPELQGRFPLRVELDALGRKEFYRILTEPKNALTIQYKALLATEEVEVEFTDDGIQEMAAFAETTNQETENIGARRLYTIMERILSDLSFEAPDLPDGTRITVDAAYVRTNLTDVMEDRDLTRYIL